MAAASMLMMRSDRHEDRPAWVTVDSEEKLMIVFRELNAETRAANTYAAFKFTVLRITSRQNVEE